MPKTNQKTPTRAVKEAKILRELRDGFFASGNAPMRLNTEHVCETRP